MIRFIVHAGHELTLRPYLAEWAGSFGRQIELVGYDELFRSTSLPCCTHVFTDLERLSADDRENAAFFWRALSEAEPRPLLLNHPLKALRRYELLRRLRESGVNDFDVYRAGEARRPARFPVFLRRENDHFGPESDLIRSQTDLDVALETLVAQGKCADARLIVEYNAEAGEDGLFRKYGAFCVRGLVIPRHVLFARDWLVKGSTKVVDDRLLAEEREYLEGNPHAEAVASIFEMANIDYGRVDYAFVGGRMQVYEINTNPTVIHAEPAPRNEKKQRFTAALTAALETLAVAPAGGNGDASVVLDVPLKDRFGRLASRLCQRMFGRQFRPPI